MSSPLTLPADPIDRASQFAERFSMRLPIFLAPMAGACPPALSRAVVEAGGMGALGALLLGAPQIDQWAREFRMERDGPLQMNLWIPDPAPERHTEQEQKVAAFLAQYGPDVTIPSSDSPGMQSFEAQCEAMLAAKPSAVSSIMGVYPAEFVVRLKDAGIAWFACVTTLAEARLAEKAGADVIIAQGAEAGGHRGAFNAADGLNRSVGLLALLPQIVDAVDLPVIATGGIADPRGMAAALILGASAVQIGSGYLQCPEAGLPAAWVQGLADSEPEGTQLTRAFSGRWGRALRTTYVTEASNGPEPAPYPIQRALTAGMRKKAVLENDVQTMQAWAGQAAALGSRESAVSLTQRLWSDTRKILAA